MKFRGGEFPTGTTGNFQPELTVQKPGATGEPASCANGRRLIAIGSTGSQYLSPALGCWFIHRFQCLTSHRAKFSTATSNTMKRKSWRIMTPSFLFSLSYFGLCRWTAM